MSYYWDTCDCKSEADEIIDEAVEKITNLIAQEVKTDLDSLKIKYDAEVASHKITKDSLEFVKKDSAKKDEYIEILEQKLKQSDSLNLYDDLIPLDTKVNVIFKDYGDKKSFIAKCPLCNGNRVIKKVIDGVEYKRDCPRCSYVANYDERTESTKEVCHYKNEIYYVAGYQLTVNQNLEKKIKYIINTRCKNDKFFREDENFFADSEDVFLDRNEALDECKKRFDNDYKEALILTGNDIPQEEIKE